MQDGEIHKLFEYKTALDEHAILAETDLKGRIVFVNSEFVRLSGYSRDELLGKNHRILNSGFHDSVFFRDLWKTIASGKIWSGEIRNRSKNGSLYWVKTTIVPFRGPEGKLERYVSLRTDITRQKVAEKEALDAEKKLFEYAEVLKVEREALKRKNIALMEVIRSFEQEKIDLKASFRNNLDQQILPLLAQVKGHLPKNARSYIDLLERTVSDIGLDSEGGAHLNMLSPMEKRIAETLKKGMSSKEAAAFFNISPRTVNKHCENIRQKLGIRGKKINLQTFLNSL